MRRAARLFVVVGIACAAAAHAAEPLPDRRAVRPGGASVAGAPTQQSVVELLMQIEALQNELRQVRGQLDVQTHEMERLKNRQRDMAADMDRRLQELERRGGAAAAPAPPGGGSTTVVTPAIGGGSPGATPAPAPPLTAGEQRAYDATIGLMKQGLYDRAAAGFREFLAKYPRSRLADNAQYWIGECAYVSRNFKLARDEYEKVLTQYPNGPKTPDALLKIGYTYYELGEFAKARESLNQVMARYPNTSVAKSAEVRLAKMTKEGH